MLSWAIFLFDLWNALFRDKICQGFSCYWALPTFIYDPLHAYCLHCNQYIKQQYSVHTLNVWSWTLSVIFLVWVRISFNSPFNELTGWWYTLPGNIILAPLLLFYRGEQSLASNLDNTGNSPFNPFSKRWDRFYQSYFFKTVTWCTSIPVSLYK